MVVAYLWVGHSSKLRRVATRSAFYTVYGRRPDNCNQSCGYRQPLSTVYCLSRASIYMADSVSDRQTRGRYRSSSDKAVVDKEKAIDSVVC